jgi:hypothetical protein
MEFKSRLGTFLIWVGIVLLLLFIAADIVEADELNAFYPLFGVIFTSLGIYLKRIGRKPPDESGRSRTLRKRAWGGNKTQHDRDGGDEGGE